MPYEELEALEANANGTDDATGTGATNLATDIATGDEVQLLGDRNASG